MKTLKLLLAAAPALLLTACGDRASENDGRAASGEVLEGTISDAMLPLDTVRSQPPLAEPEAAARATANAEAEASAAPDAEAGEAADESDEAAPAEEAAPEAGEN